MGSIVLGSLSLFAAIMLLTHAYMCATRSNASEAEEFLGYDDETRTEAVVHSRDPLLKTGAWEVPNELKDTQEIDLTHWIETYLKPRKS